MAAPGIEGPSRKSLLRTCIGPLPASSACQVPWVIQRLQAHQACLERHSIATAQVEVQVQVTPPGAPGLGLLLQQQVHDVGQPGSQLQGQAH